MKKRIKFNGILMLMALLLVVFFPLKIIRRIDYSLDTYWEILGIALILAGQLLRVSARGYKAEKSRSGNSLVVTGPYSMVRNPMYLGIVLIGSGIVLAVLNIWVLLIFFAGFLILYTHLFPKEEKILRDAFGKTYTDYCAKVPRIIPKLKFIFQNDVSFYLPLRLSWFKREMLSISLVLLAVLFVESWEEIWHKGWRNWIPGIAPFLVSICLCVILVVFLAKIYEKSPIDGKDQG